MKKIATIAVAITCAAALFTACSGKKAAKGGAASAEATGYTFGEEKTFHSDEKVTYSISFSDASWYAMQDTWKTEGVFKDIEDLTNVHLDITSYDSGDYGQKVNLAINSGNPTYIIPKIYDENQYVSGGGVVAVSDYTQYMPNFTAFVNKYNMNPDLDTIRQNDGISIVSLVCIRQLFRTIQSWFVKIFLKLQATISASLKRTGHGKAFTMFSLA